MRTISSLVLLSVLVAASATAVDAAPRPGLGRVIAERLQARKAERDRTRATQLTGTEITCLTLSRREMRSFGFPGHAFVCEEFATGELLGAVLNRAGFAICDISGSDRGDGCFDVDICQVPETLCLQ